MGEQIAIGIPHAQKLNDRDTDEFEFAFETFDIKRCELGPLKNVPAIILG